MDQHEIPDEEVEFSLETLAVEYSKQDGTQKLFLFLIELTLFLEDATMKVSVDILHRVYESLQDQGQRTDVEKELIDPESHLFIINAFDMPLWRWSQESGTFAKLVYSYYRSAVYLTFVGQMHHSQYPAQRSLGFRPSAIGFLSSNSVL